MVVFVGYKPSIMESAKNPPKAVIGPQLPFNRSNESSESDNDSNDDTYGPALPPQKLEERDEWMTTAPEVITASVGLTVASCIKKKDDNNEAYKKAMAERDAKMVEAVEEYNREKRPISLLEMHQLNKKMRKRKNNNDEQERKPFDREEDLKIRRMDSRQTSSVINNAKFLDSRFSAGSQRFL